MDLAGVSVPRSMSWTLTPVQDGVACGLFRGQTGAYRADGPLAYIVGLLPGFSMKELPVGETAVRARLFKNLFFDAGGQFPGKDFRASGWVSTTSWTSNWWLRMIEAVLSKNSDALRSLNLFTPIRAT